MCQDKRVSNLDLVVIAGPQASGKTTGWEFLKNKYGQVADFYEEMNQNILFPEKVKLGSIIVDAKMERKIHEADIASIAEMKMRNKLRVAETLMFHVVYYEEMVDKEFYERGKKDYQEALREFQVGVIFIDTRPEVSFRRRESEYERRIKNEIERRGLGGSEAKRFRQEMRGKYLRKMKERYPLWKQVYDEIDYAEKRVIDNNDLSEEEFLKQVVEVFEAMLVI